MIKSFLRINKNSLINNLNLVRKISGTKKKIFPVVKANGYGIGAENLVSIFIEQGCEGFFVASLAEGVFLRSKFYDIKIYILYGICNQHDVDIAVKYSLIPVLNSLHQVSVFSNSITKEHKAVIHIDSGMNRLGISFNELENIKEIKLFNNIEIEFIMTHLSSAEELGSEVNKIQLARFYHVLDKISYILNQKPKISISNSGGVLLNSEYHGDILRPGACLYGINLDIYNKNLQKNYPEIARNAKFKNVIEIFTQVLQIHKVQKGCSIGYNEKFVASSDMIVATIAAGYADGILRKMQNGYFYLKGNRVKILGVISMDLVVIDITNIKEEIKIGDYCEILGNNVKISQVAKLYDSIEYEVLTSIGKRYKRVIE
jgi:alanine racemase